jgi:hypothetical protein
MGNIMQIIWAIKMDLDILLLLIRFLKGHLPMVFLTWPEMSGNGVMIGIKRIIIRVRPKKIPWVHKTGPSALYGAAVGLVVPGTFVVAIAIATSPQIAIYTLASVFARTINLFTFTLLPFNA